jgi:hypothetical protein
MLRRAALLFVVLAPGLFAQYYGGGAGVRAVPTLPTDCNPGQVVTLTTAPAGQQLYVCGATARGTIRQWSLVPGFVPNSDDNFHVKLMRVPGIVTAPDFSTSRLVVNSLSTPAAPTVTKFGLSTASTYTYRVIAWTPDSLHTDAGPTVTVTNTDSVSFSAGAHNLITLPAVQNAAYCQIYATETGFLTNKGLLRNPGGAVASMDCGGTFNHTTGMGYDGSDPPTANTTGIATFNVGAVITPIPISLFPAPSADNTNVIRVASDGLTSSDCGIGGGTFPALCISTGAAWVSLGGSSTGFTPTAPTVRTISVAAGTYRYGTNFGSTPAVTFTLQNVTVASIVTGATTTVNTSVAMTNLVNGQSINVQLTGTGAGCAAATGVFVATRLSSTQFTIPANSAAGCALTSGTVGATTGGTMVVYANDAGQVQIDHPAAIGALVSASAGGIANQVSAAVMPNGSMPIASAGIVAGVVNTLTSQVTPYYAIKISAGQGIDVQMSGGQALVSVGPTVIQGDQPAAFTSSIDATAATKTAPNRTGTGSPNGRDNCTKAGETFYATDLLLQFTCTAPGTPGTWASLAVDPTAGLFFMEDNFPGNRPDIDPCCQLAWVRGAGTIGNVMQVAGTLTHPGVKSMTTGAVSGNQAYIHFAYGGNGSNFFNLATGIFTKWEQTNIVQLDNAAGVAAIANIGYQFGSSVTAASCNSGAWCIAADTTAPLTCFVGSTNGVTSVTWNALNWMYVMTVNGGNNVCLDSGISAQSGTWYTLKIAYNTATTTTTFTINGAAARTVPSSPPTAIQNPFMLTTTHTASAKAVWLDYWKFVGWY